MPDGHATDVELILPGGKLACQVTVADPSWAEEGPGSSGGYLHHLQMECLREGRLAFGGAYTAKTEGKIVSTPHARDVTEDLVACRRSLASATSRTTTPPTPQSPAAAPHRWPRSTVNCSIAASG